MPTEREIKRWEKWQEKAPLAYLAAGLVMFPVGGWLLSFLDSSSVVGVGWGVCTGFIWGIFMMFYDQRRMEKYFREKRASIQTKT